MLACSQNRWHSQRYLCRYAYHSLVTARFADRRIDVRSDHYSGRFSRRCAGR
jgi:hypothetical protein